MHCPACGAPTPAGASFCPQCGKALARTGDAPSTRQAPSPFRPDSAPAEPEKDLWQGSYSWKAMIGAWVAAAVATPLLLVAAYFVANSQLTSPGVAWGIAVGIALLLWLGNGLVLLYRQMSISYRLTTELLIIQRGILFVSFDRLELIDIDDITVVQGLIDRLLGVGQITILSSDTSDPRLELIGVDNVQEVSEILDRARRKRRERAVKMEAI